MQEYAPLLNFIGSVLVGILSLIGVVYVSRKNSQNMLSQTEEQLRTSQKLMSNDLQHLTAEVKKHNDFANRVPQLEVKIEALQKSTDDKFTLITQRIDDLSEK